MLHRFHAPRPARLRAAGLAAALLLAVLPSCRSNDKGEPDPDKTLAMHREFALRYFEDDELERSEQQVDKGLAIDPDDGSLRLMKGWIRQRRGGARDLFVAEKIFRELAPEGDYRALLGLAEALERQGVLYDESGRAVESGERSTPAPDPVARGRELRAEAATRWKESVAWYEKTLSKKPGEAQAVNGLQRVHALLGEYEESLVWAGVLLEQSGGETAFWRAQLQRPELTAREEERLRALLAASTRLQVETLLQASSLLHRLGRAEEALAHVERVVALAPEEPDAYSRRAQLERDLGRNEQALASIQEFLKLSKLDYDHPDIARAYDLLTQCERELGRAPQVAR